MSLRYIFIAIAFIIIIVVFVISSKTKSQGCVTQEWSSVNDGWSECIPDCNGKQTRTVKKIIKDPNGDCHTDIEERQCVCQIDLGNKIIELNKKYTYQDFIGGNVDNILVPKNTKIQVKTNSDNMYAVLGEKVNYHKIE